MDLTNLNFEGKYQLQADQMQVFGDGLQVGLSPAPSTSHLLSFSHSRVMFWFFTPNFLYSLQGIFSEQHGSHGAHQGRFPPAVGF